MILCHYERINSNIVVTVPVTLPIASKHLFNLVFVKCGF